jgi:hypothetical protein
VWGTAAFATAVGNLTEVCPGTAPDGTTQERAVPRRVVVGNLGYDVSFTAASPATMAACLNSRHPRSRWSTSYGSCCAGSAR